MLSTSHFVRGFIRWKAFYVPAWSQWAESQRGAMPRLQQLWLKELPLDNIQFLKWHSALLNDWLYILLTVTQYFEILSLQESLILLGFWDRFSLGSCQHLEVSYTAENLCVLSPDKHSHSLWLALTHMHSCLKHLCPAKRSSLHYTCTPIRYLLQQNVLTNYKGK